MKMGEKHFHLHRGGSWESGDQALQATAGPATTACKHFLTIITRPGSTEFLKSDPAGWGVGAVRCSARAGLCAVQVSESSVIFVTAESAGLRALSWQYKKGLGWKRY